MYGFTGRREVGWVSEARTQARTTEGGGWVGEEAPKGGAWRGRKLGRCALGVLVGGIGHSRMKVVTRQRGRGAKKARQTIMKLEKVQ